MCGGHRRGAGTAHRGQGLPKSAGPGGRRRAPSIGKGSARRRATAAAGHGHDSASHARPGRADPATERLIDEGRRLRTALTELRNLARGIHPAVLTDQGLPAAFGMLARRCPLPVDLQGDLPDRPPPHIEAAGYYLISAALQNAVKHGHAARVIVRMRSNGGPGGRRGRGPTRSTGRDCRRHPPKGPTTCPLPTTQQESRW